MSKHTAGDRVVVRKDNSCFGPGTVEEVLEGSAVYKVLLDSGGSCMCPADWVSPLPPEKDPLPVHVREAHEAARRAREEAVRKAREEAMGWNFKVGDRVEFWVATSNPRKFGPGTVHAVLADARYKVCFDNGKDAIIRDENLKPLPGDRDPLAKRSRRRRLLAPQDAAAATPADAAGRWPDEGLVLKDAIDNDATASSEVSTSSNSRAGFSPKQGSMASQKAEAAELRRLERAQDGKSADRDNRGVTFVWVSEHSQQDSTMVHESTVEVEPADAEYQGLGAEAERGEREDTGTAWESTLEAEPTEAESLDLDTEMERCLEERRHCASPCRAEELAEDPDELSHAPCMCGYWCFAPTVGPKHL